MHACLTKSHGNPLVLCREQSLIWMASQCTRQAPELRCGSIPGFHGKKMGQIWGTIGQLKTYGDILKDIRNMGKIWQTMGTSSMNRGFHWKIPYELWFIAGKIVKLNGRLSNQPHGWLSNQPCLMTERTVNVLFRGGLRFFFFVAHDTTHVW